VITAVLLMSLSLGQWSTAGFAADPPRPKPKSAAPAIAITSQIKPLVPIVKPPTECGNPACTGCPTGSCGGTGCPCPPKPPIAPAASQTPAGPFYATDSTGQKWKGPHALYLEAFLAGRESVFKAQAQQNGVRVPPAAAPPPSWQSFQAPPPTFGPPTSGCPGGQCYGR
jgi:hypothetical protein